MFSFGQVNNIDIQALLNVFFPDIRKHIESLPSLISSDFLHNLAVLSAALQNISNRYSIGEMYVTALNDDTIGLSFPLFKKKYNIAVSPGGVSVGEDRASYLRSTILIARYSPRLVADIISDILSILKFAPRINKQFVNQLSFLRDLLSELDRIDSNVKVNIVTRLVSAVCDSESTRSLRRETRGNLIMWTSGWSLPRVPSLVDEMVNNVKMYRGTCFIGGPVGYVSTILLPEINTLIRVESTGARSYDLHIFLLPSFITTSGRFTRVWHEVENGEGLEDVFVYVPAKVPSRELVDVWTEFLNNFIGGKYLVKEVEQILSKRSN